MSQWRWGWQLVPCSNRGQDQPHLRHISIHLTRFGFLIRRYNFLRDHILRVTAPAQEEVPDILVVSLPLIVHLGLYWRGGLTPAQLAVEGLTLNIHDKLCNFYQSYPHLGHELSWHQRVPAINPAGVVTVGPGSEQLGGQPLPLDPGHRGPEKHKVCTQNRFLTSGLT